MNVKELIEKLKEYPEDMRVMIADVDSVCCLHCDILRVDVGFEVFDYGVFCIDSPIVHIDEPPTINILSISKKEPEDIREK